MNMGGRVICCGNVSNYEKEKPVSTGPRGIPGLSFLLLGTALRELGHDMKVHAILVSPPKSFCKPSCLR